MGFKRLSLLTLIAFALSASECRPEGTSEPTYSSETSEEIVLFPNTIIATRIRIPKDDPPPEVEESVESEKLEDAKSRTKRSPTNLVKAFIPPEVKYHYKYSIIVTGIFPAVLVSSFDVNSIAPVPYPGIQVPNNQYPPTPKSDGPYPGAGVPDIPTQQPGKKPVGTPTRFGGEEEDKITFKDDNDNDSYNPYVGGRPAMSPSPSSRPASDREADFDKYYNTATGITLDKIPPPRPNTKSAPPIHHSPNSYRRRRGAQQEQKEHVLIKGPTGGGCGDCKPLEAKDRL